MKSWFWCITSLLVVGLLQFDTKPNSDAIPHTWLGIESLNKPIDNTFVYIPPRNGKSMANLLFQTKHPDLYVQEDPITTKRKIVLCTKQWICLSNIVKSYENIWKFETYWKVSCVCVRHAFIESLYQNVWYTSQGVLRFILHYLNPRCYYQKYSCKINNAPYVHVSTLYIHAVITLLWTYLYTFRSHSLNQINRYRKERIIQTLSAFQALF